MPGKRANGPRGYGLADCRLRARGSHATRDLVRDDLLRARQRARADVRRRLGAQAALQPTAPPGRVADRLREGLQARREAGSATARSSRPTRSRRASSSTSRTRTSRPRSAEGGHAFDIEQFVPIDDIDPIYFEHSYYLAPQDGAEKVYTLLVQAMKDAGPRRDRDVPDAGPRVPRLPADPDGVITLERMYFADEIRPPEDLRPKGARVSKEELEMAASLIDRFRGDFDPEALPGHLHRQAPRRHPAQAQGRGDPRRAGGRGRGDARSDGGAESEPGRTLEKAGPEAEGAGTAQVVALPTPSSSRSSARR